MWLVTLLVTKPRAPSMSPRKDREAPTLRVGRYYSGADLANAAFNALSDAGVTHETAAKEIGAPHRTAVTRALDPDNSAGLDLCAKILARYGGTTFDPEAPHFRLERP